MLHRPDWDFGTSGLARQVLHVRLLFFLPSLRVCIIVLAFLGGYVLPFRGYEEEYHIAPCMRRRQGF